MYFRQLIFCWTAAVVLLQVSADTSSQSDGESKLLRKLSETYLPSVNPGSIKIVMGMAYTCASFDKSTDILTSRVFERYAWVDHRLVWNPSEYNGVNRIRVPSDKIWTPDIKLFNAIDESEARDEARAIVLANGTVYWFPPCTYKTHCTSADVKGTSSCHIRIGSWAYPADQIELEIFNTGFDTDFYSESCPYAITEPHVDIVNRFYRDYPECGDDPYPTFDVSFKIHKRQPSERHPDAVHPIARTGRSRADIKQDLRKSRCDWPTCTSKGTN